MKKGILIYDLGAYSIDATYVCISGDNKKTWDASLALGGHSVEVNLLNILMDNQHISEDQIYDISSVITDLRIVKENYYNGDRITPIKLQEDVAHVTVTGEQISDAVTTYKFENERPENFPQESSWLDHQASFIDYTKEKLANSPIDTVLVMGGASNMTEAFNLIKQKRGSNVYRLDSPNTKSDEVSMNEAVPIGSALHFAQSLRVMRELPELSKNLKHFVRFDLDWIIAEKCAAELRYFVWSEIILEAVREWKLSNTDENVNQLQDRIQSKMNSKKDKIREKLTQSIRIACKSTDAMSKLYEVVGNFYGKIYNEEWRKELKLDHGVFESSMSGVVSSELLEQVANSLSSEDLINMLSNTLSDILGAALGLILIAVFAYLLWPFLMIIGAIVIVADVVESAWEGTKKLFMNDVERRIYEADKKLKAERNARLEKKRREEERRENERKEKAKPRTKKQREEIFDKLCNPEKYNDKIKIQKNDGTEKEVPLKEFIDESKQEIYNKIKNTVLDTLRGQLESRNYFGIPDIVIQAITEEIEAAVYVG